VEKKYRIVSAEMERMKEENKELKRQLELERQRANSMESLIRSEQNFVLGSLDEINKHHGNDNDSHWKGS